MTVAAPELPTPAASVPDLDPRLTGGRVDSARLRRLAQVAFAGSGDEGLAVYAAGTGKLLGTLPRSTPADVPVAVARARAAQDAWAQRRWSDRAAIFVRYHDLLLARQDEGLDVIQLESGKARKHAFEEI